MEEPAPTSDLAVLLQADAHLEAVQDGGAPEKPHQGQLKRSPSPAQAPTIPAPASPALPVFPSVRRAPPLPPPLPPALPKPKAAASPAVVSRPTTRSAAGGGQLSSRAASEAGSADAEDGTSARAKPAWAKSSKTRWTPDEDAELLRIISLSPTLSWEDIAAKMPGRKASGCAMRWYNFVRKTADPAMRHAGTATSISGGSENGAHPAANGGIDSASAPLDKVDKGKGKDHSDYGAEGNDPTASTSEGRAVSTLSVAAPERSLPPLARTQGTVAPQARTIYSPRDPIANTAAAPSGSDVSVSVPRSTVIRGRRTHSPGQLEGTLFTPHGKVQKIHPCPSEGCAAAFKRSEHLKRHFRSVHMGAKPFPCEASHCPKSFSRKDNLQQHMKMVHGVQAPPSSEALARAYPTCLVPSQPEPAAVGSSGRAIPPHGFGQENIEVPQEIPEVHPAEDKNYEVEEEDGDVKGNGGDDLSRRLPTSSTVPAAAPEQPVVPSSRPRPFAGADIPVAAPIPTPLPFSTTQPVPFATGSPKPALKIAQVLRPPSPIPIAGGFDMDLLDWALLPGFVSPTAPDAGGKRKHDELTNGHEAPQDGVAAKKAHVEGFAGVIS